MFFVNQQQSRNICISLYNCMVVFLFYGLLMHDLYLCML